MQQSRNKLILGAVLALSSLGANATSNDNNGVQKQIDDLRAGLHDVHMNTLTKYSESWGLEDRGNIAALQKDQKRQDEQVAGYVATQIGRDAWQDEHINAVQNAAQTANDRASSLEGRADASENAIRSTQGAAQTANDRATVLETRADGAEAVNVAQEVKLGQHDSTLVDHETRITQNTSDLGALYSEASYSASRIDAANANNEANRQALVSTNNKVADNTAQLANHEQRLGQLEQQTSRAFADMNGKIDRVERKANAGTSAALSSAAIPQVTEYQRFALGAGVGGYEGESALAVGFSSRVSSAVVLKASVTTDSQHGFGYGAGMSVGW